MPRLPTKTAMGAIADNDLLHLVDVSDLASYPTGTSKKMTILQLSNKLLGGLLTTPVPTTLVGGLTAAHSMTGIEGAVYGNLAGNSLTSAPGATLVGYNSGALATTITGITAIGASAAANSTVAITAGGYQSAFSNTVGANNTSWGDRSSYANLIGGQNSSFGYLALFGNLTDDNVGVGYLAGYGASGGFRRTIVGRSAGEAGAGNYCVLMGFKSGRLLTGASYDVVAIGSTAAYEGISIYESVLVGNNSGRLLTNHSRVVMVGHDAGKAATTSNSVLIGYQAGKYCTVNGATYVGHQCGVTAAGINLGIGYRSLFLTTGGYGSVGVGYESIYSSITGHYITAVGHQAAKAFLGDGLTAIGYQAGLAATSAIGATLAGHLAGTALTIGAYTTAIGFETLKSMISNSASTAVGYHALLMATAGLNTAVGAFCLDALTLGYNCCGFGVESLSAITTQIDCTAMGYKSGGQATSSKITAIGSHALEQCGAAATEAIGIGYYAGRISTGAGAILMGNRAGYANTAQYLIAIGDQAAAVNTGANITCGGYNTLLLNQGGANLTTWGCEALKSNIAGSNSTAIGYRAALLSIAGQVTAVGSLSGSGLTSGTPATFLGYDAGSDAVAQTNITLVGHGSRIGSHGNNSNVLGNSTQTTYVDGLRLAVGVTTTPLASTGCLVDVGGSTQVAGGIFPIIAMTSNHNVIDGLQLQNLSAGTSAEMRFITAADDDSYLAFTQPSSGNVGTFFGVTKSTGSFMFNYGAGQRNMGVGTLGIGDLIFGTADTERMRISSSRARFTLGDAIIVDGGAADADFDTDEVLSSGILACYGIITVGESVDSVTGIFRVENQTLIVISANAAYSIIKDNAGTYNVYWDANQFKVQNKVGDNKNIKISFSGVS